MGKPATGAIGRRSEEQARRFLRSQGFRIISQNFRRRGGEIDLIAIDADCLVFVEVRYRETSNFVAACETVDHRKQQKLIRTAAMFVSKNPLYADFVMRFDVVAIHGGTEQTTHHFRDAFRPNHSTY